LCIIVSFCIVHYVQYSVLCGFSGAGTFAIDNKIEQAMVSVATHGHL